MQYRWRYFLQAGLYLSSRRVRQEEIRVWLGFCQGHRGRFALFYLAFHYLEFPYEGTFSFVDC